MPSVQFSDIAMKLSLLFVAGGLVPLACGQPLFGSALGPAPAAAPAQASDTLAAQCEVDTSGPICLGDQVLLPPALPPGLVGYWSFDEPAARDISGHGIHGMSAVVAGPSFAGQGGSSFFHKTYQTIPASPVLTLRDFSYTFWVYFVEHTSHQAGSSHLCSIVRKGLASNSGAVQGGAAYASSPVVFYHPESKRLHVEISTTTDNVVSSVEGFESNARLKRGRWFHIALVRLDGQRKTRLYVNGLLDSSAGTHGFTMANSEPLYVGGDPVSQQTCDVPMYVDELKVYSRHLTPDEIQAEAAPALAGIEPSFVRLACVDCPLEVAMANCPDGYHICNSLELHMGGYQVARTLGWLGPSAHVWSHAPSANVGLQSHGTLTRASLAQQQAGSSMSGVPIGLQPMVATPAPANQGLGVSTFEPQAAGAPAPAAAGLGLGLCCVDDDAGTSGI